MNVAEPPGGVTGLTSVDVATRLREYGANELAAAPRLSLIRELAKGLASPLMLILLAASVLAGFIGEVTDAIIIGVTVLLGAGLDALQTTRSSAAVERLRHSIVPTATVYRDGGWTEIARRDVVPGDVIGLSAGDVIPADARLVTSRDLHVQQGALTGESFPAEKEAGEASVAPPGGAARLADPNQRDAVFLGTSVVSGTGTAIVTATGRHTAFGEIAARLRDAPPPTELERGLRRFGRMLAQTVVFLVLFLVLVSIALHRDPLESLLFAVALAVGVVPEFMPMVTSITLATGAVRMSRRRVIVKHLAAIHNFGSIDVLCTDKTGTLTASEMRLESATEVTGRPSRRVEQLAAMAAYLQAGVRNPLDDAIRRATSAPPGIEKLDEVPFDFERRRVSVVVRCDDSMCMIVKGAPASVLSACTAVRNGDESVPLDGPARDAADASVRRVSERGLRTLAIATRRLDGRPRPYRREDECDLTLEGWLSFEDPPLPDAADTVSALAADGVQLKILTGDDDAVACHICSATGVDASHVMLGSDVDRVTDAALGVIAEQTTVFARVSPQQKLRVLMALQMRGHVVGYMGDGINDAPALHAADVGISVAGAVDVAKDAADIVLLDRGLGVLHAGIVEGRKAFGNVMKYLLMGTSSNFGNMFSMAVASLIVPFLPMLPTQILLNNFLYDLSQVAIPSDRVDDAYVRQPHHWDVRVLRRFMIRIGLVSSVFDLITFGVLLRWFGSTPALFRTGWFIESLLTQTLVLFVIRTTGRPWQSRPSPWLAITVVSAAIVGVALPYSPVGALLGFVVPPASFIVFVCVLTVVYLVCVDVAKARLAPM